MLLRYLCFIIKNLYKEFFIRHTLYLIYRPAFTEVGNPVERPLDYIALKVRFTPNTLRLFHELCTGCYSDRPLFKAFIKISDNRKHHNLTIRLAHPQLLMKCLDSTLGNSVV